MKVVFLSDDFPPESFGGAGISTYELAKAMREAGHEVFVITAGKRDEETLFEGLKIFKINCKYHERWRAYLSLYNPRAVKKVEEILKKIRPDIVHANNIHFYLSYHCLQLAKKYAKGVAVTLRDAMAFSFGKLATEKYLKSFNAHLSWLDQWKQTKKRWNPLRNFIIRQYLKKADKVFAVSHALKDALAQNGIKNVEVLHTGLNLSEYTAQGLPNRKVIFFSGRLSEAKGVRVVEELKMIMPEAEFLTAGTGLWLSREEMKQAISNSRVVLVPSICFDAFPRTVLEAMALSRPVVATPYGGAKEVVVDGVTGFIADPFNIDEFVSRVKDLLDNPKKSESFGRSGRERIEKEFNLSQKVQEFLQQLSAS